MSTLAASRLRASVLGAGRQRYPFAVPRSATFVLARAMASSSDAAKKKKEFMILVPDKPNNLELRKKVRPSHFEYTTPLVECGKLVLGGATVDDHPAGSEFPSMNGSLLIYTVESMQEAYELFKTDPYAVNGVWDVEKAQISPYISAVRLAK